jgi:signal transduction histidine kinase
MSDQGFAIRCPHCRKWNIWPNVHPDERALNSKQELNQIFKGLSKASLLRKPDSFSHEKLFRCGSPRWKCPASFEAFICRSEDDTRMYLKEVDAWTFKRDFRLCKSDCIGRWDNEEQGKYYGILFNTLSVPRQQEIDLELLIDRELLSRIILGVGQEIRAPFTIFTANIFELEGGERITYWMPIESYSLGHALVPEAFNEFCQCCRKVIVDTLIKKFESRKISVNNCPIHYGKNGKCAGKAPACMKDPKDWNHCPAFMIERKECLCTSSDLESIRIIESKWMAGESLRKGVMRKCPAGFTEVGFPIVVHDHVLGVGMTGQFFFDEKDIEKIDNLVRRWSILEGSQKELERARQKLIDEEYSLVEQGKTKFLVTDERLQTVKSLLHANIERIAEMANSRYRDFRGRTESAFREEMLGFIQHHKKERNFFDNRVKNILERMRVFWAFEAVYLAGYSFVSKNISVIAFGHKYRQPQAFGLPGKKVGHADIKEYQMHPCPYLHMRGEETPRNNQLINDLLPIFENAIHDRDLEVPQGKYYFFVLIPFLQEVYVFVFAVRDEEAIAHLKQRVPGIVSELCQDEILETCIEIVYEFGDVKSFVELKEQALKAAYVVEISSLGANLAHTMGNKVGTIPNMVQDIKERLGELEVVDKYLLSRLANMENDAKALLQLKSQFNVRNFTQELERIDVLALITKAMRSVDLEGMCVDVVVERGILGKLPMVFGVENLLVSTLTNIIENAIKADAKRVVISGRKREDVVDIAISDDGVGMSEEEIAKIWSPFHESKSVGYGLHIGLATSRLVIVQRMAGDISVKSVQGKGSIFTITLRTDSVNI